MLRIRTATPGDHLAITYVTLDAYGEFRHTVPTESYRSYMADLLDLESRARQGELMVADSYGVVGTATFYAPDAARQLGWPEGWALVGAIAVSPFIRRRGVGGELLDWCIDRADQIGAPVLGLHAAGFMTAAARMYRAFGFDRVPDLDIVPHDTPPTHAYALPLEDHALAATAERQRAS